MSRRIHGLLVAALLAATVAPAAAQVGADAIAPAEPGSVPDQIGQAILYFAGGRTLEEMGGPSFNPFQIDGDALLFAVGAFFVTTDYAGESVHEGELAIFPQFGTPYGAFEPGETSAGIIPFALMRAGVCHAGFVSGYPAPEAVYAVDLSGLTCHAALVEEIVYAQYAANNPPQPAPGPETEPATPEKHPPAGGFDPAAPSDIDLDVIVWAAYEAAYALAMNDPDYLFVRDGDANPLRLAIRDAIEAQEMLGILFPPLLDDPAQAVGCAQSSTAELRLAVTPDGAGITLVVATNRRQSSYRYDPGLSPNLDVRTASECRSEGLGRASTGNF